MATSNISFRPRLECFLPREFELKLGIVPRYAKGCLLGNLSAEVADHSPLVRERPVEYFHARSLFLENCTAEAREEGAVGGGIPAAVLGRFVLNSWEGALMRMRAERSDAPLIEFKQVIFDRFLSRYSR
jgi:TetR/AcrR family transcriptional repressor of nem operon